MGHTIRARGQSDMLNSIETADIDQTFKIKEPN